jgi:hypothetical protein
MSAEVAAEFIDVALSEPLRVRVTVPGHLAENLIATQPMLDRKIYVMIPVHASCFTPRAKEIGQFLSQIERLTCPGDREKNWTRRVATFVVIHNESSRSR